MYGGEYERVNLQKKDIFSFAIPFFFILSHSNSYCIFWYYSTSHIFLIFSMIHVFHRAVMRISIDQTVIRFEDDVYMFLQLTDVLGGGGILLQSQVISFYLYPSVCTAFLQSLLKPECQPESAGNRDSSHRNTPGEQTDRLPAPISCKWTHKTARGPTKFNHRQHANVSTQFMLNWHKYMKVMFRD